jgi:phage terminase large subunit
MQIDVTNTYLRNWKTTKKIIVNRGGTRSSKTYSLCQMLMVWLMSGRIRENTIIEKGVASVVRKYSTTISKTVERDFYDVLSTHNVLGLIDYNKTNKTFKYMGRMVEFFGADDQQKIRGYKSNILFCNEVNELGFKTEFSQLLFRTTDLIFMDFNPSDPYVWVNEKIEQERAAIKGDVEIIVSTYKDNPYLNKEQVQEIEYLEQTDPELWKVYGLGEYGKVEGLIIKGIEIIDEMPEDIKKLGAGMDFGFSNDPTALYVCGIRENRQTNQTELYLDELIYNTGLTDSDIIAKFSELGINKNLSIYGDSAQPSTIEEIRRAGYNIRPVIKKQDSLKHGLQIMKRCRIFVTSRSVGFIREQKQYKYKMMPNGEYTNEPLDVYNHAMDAVRYYCLMNLSSVVSGFGFANQPR